MTINIPIAARQPSPRPQPRRAPVVDMHRAQDHGDMAFYGAHANAELDGDLPVGAPGGDQHEDIELARRQVEVPNVSRCFRMPGCRCKQQMRARHRDFAASATRSPAARRSEGTESGISAAT